MSKGAQGPMADSFAQMFLVLGLNLSSEPAQCSELAAGASLSILAAELTCVRVKVC